MHAISSRAAPRIQFATLALILTLAVSACAPNLPAPNPAEPTLPAPTEPSKKPGTTTGSASEPSATKGSPGPAPAPVAKGDVIEVTYHDDFTDPATGWPEAKFDNYFIGYHEPEYYHIEIDSANSKASVFAPDKQSYEDVTLVVSAQINSKKTAPEGDFQYGVAFRRTGDQYYVFTISPHSQKWAFLKSSPSELKTLAEGADSSLHPADADDVLRVDAKGSTFYLHVNDRLVAQVTDTEYAAGEVGFYVQTLDSTQAHIHFDDLVIRSFSPPDPSQPGSKALAHDDFTDPATGWPEAKFDNYFIGYHEPEYYHVELDSAQTKVPVFDPGKESYQDFTLQVAVQVNSKKTAATGDFLYGPVFRRSGDQYYAFAVSPRTQRWVLLKSSPTSLKPIADGRDSTLHLADADDILRVDAQGSTFSLHINDRLVAQVTDADYASGEIGFYVQTLDSAQAHVHFDDLLIAEYDAPHLCTVTAGAGGLNLRSGPGSSFPSLASLAAEKSMEPIGHSADGQWLNVRQTSGDTGWVNSADKFVTCNTDISALPVIIP